MQTKYSELLDSINKDIGTAQYLTETRYPRGPIAKEDYVTMHTACREGHIETVETLLNLGIDPNSRNLRDHPSQDYLYQACMGYHFEIVRMLAHYGARFDAAAACFVAPNNQVFTNQHIELMTFMVSLGANIDSPLDLGFTPLMRTTQNVTTSEQIKNIDTLLRLGADPTCERGRRSIEGNLNFYCVSSPELIPEIRALLDKFKAMEIPKIHFDKQAWYADSAMEEHDFLSLATILADNPPIEKIYLVTPRDTINSALTENVVNALDQALKTNTHLEKIIFSGGYSPVLSERHQTIISKLSLNKNQNLSLVKLCHVAKNSFFLPKAKTTLARDIPQNEVSSPQDRLTS